MTISDTLEELEMLRRENQELKKQKIEDQSLIDIMSEEIEHLESELKSQKIENQKLQGKNMSLELTINSYKSRCQTPVIIEGDESDLYPGEQKDLILSYISEKANNLDPSSRQYHICKSILDANPPSGNRDYIRKQLFEVLKGCQSLSILPHDVKDGLRDIGISIDKSGSNSHPKLIFHNDDRYSMRIPCTPSDPKSFRNTAFDYARKIL